MSEDDDVCPECYRGWGAQREMAVLMAARELADAVAHIEAEWVDKPGWLYEPVSVVGVECRNAFAALALFRKVDGNDE